MIYLTAMIVESRELGRGINSYHYRRPGPPPLYADGSIDVQCALKDPGELIDFETEIRPGGNRVPAFLDMVVTDCAKDAEVRSFVAEVATLLQSDRPPLVRSSSHVGVHFNTDIGLYPEATATFDTLCSCLLRRLKNPPAVPVQERSPFVVRVHLEEGAMYYDLDEPSMRKLKKHKGHDWHATPVRVEQQTLDDFELLIGDFASHMGLLVTRLGEGELLRYGGVRYVDAASGAILAEWPARRGGVETSPPTS